MSESSILGKRHKRQAARRQRTRFRVRRRVRGTAERPRLAVFKSSRHIYAQIIDDDLGATLVAASTLDPSVKSKIKGSTSSKEAARLVGETVAERAKEKGVEKVVFDRGGYIFHGKVREVASGAREQGLDF